MPEGKGTLSVEVTVTVPVDPVAWILRYGPVSDAGFREGVAAVVTVAALDRLKELEVLAN